MDELVSTPSSYPLYPVGKSWQNIQTFLARLNDQEVDNIPVGYSYVTD